jgi:hypothetical protein
MIRIRIAVLALATGMSPALAAPIEVALVENVMGAPAGVKLMDYVETGKTIQLASSDGIVLSYLSSCVRESIAGAGIVTIDIEQSEVQGGRVARSKVACDAGKMVLEGNKPAQFAGRIFRGAAAGKSAPEPQIVLYGRSPLVELKAPGALLIERLDQTSERYLVDVASEHLLHGKFYDFARWGRDLAAGGLYRISLDGQGVVFKIDPSAKPGNTPIVGRLLRFGSSR